VVTGSRIVRRDLEAPSPIVTVGAEAFDQSSNFAVETVLNQYPQFAPAESQFTAADVQPQPGSSPGVSTLDLRNLGAGRSLVLLDGRRAQPVNAGMTVDVNMIPSALISNVEVITGGAAATYGPDAMAGVVNFKLKTDFEGIALSYQGGWTDIGDGEETRADALIGGNFDRGNAVVALSYADRDLAYQNNRDFYVNIWNDPGTPANYPRVGYPHWTPDPFNRASQAAMDQVFPTPGQSPTPDIYINPATGSVFRLARALTTGGYDGPTTFPYKIREHNGQLEQTNPRSYLSSALTRYAAFGRATYELMENVNFFAQGMFVQSTVNAKGPPTPMTGGVLVPRDPANEAAELTILLDSRRLDPDGAGPLPAGPPGSGANEPWRVTRVAYWKDNRATTNRTKLNEIVLGFNGNVGASDWTYEAYHQYGSTVLLTQQDNFMWMDRYNALAAQPNFGRGASITVNAANEHLLTKELTCTSGLPVMEDYHIDLEGNINYTSGFELSQDCWDATSANMLQQNLVEQRVTEANFQGRVLNMPRGELRGAFGISQRNNSSDYRPDELFLASTEASGETDVMEYYGELLIPVTERFELEVGSRLSDFETGGFSKDAKSHKALFSWQAAEVLRFRGGWQRAGRTPNVAELYAGSSSAVAGGDDPCRVDTNLAWSNVPSNPNREQVQQLCAELNYRSGAPVGNRFDVDPDNFPSDGATTADVYRLFSEGNPRLDPEIADTLTFGAVWQAANRNLTLSADWYEIDIQDVVGDLDFPTAHEQCFNSSGSSNPTYSINNEYCERIWRDPVTANASYVRGGNFNLSQRFTSGIDYSLSWSAPLANLGFDGPAEIGVRTSLNVLLSWKEPESASPEAPLREFAGYGTNFDYKVFTTFSYARDALNISLNWRYLPSSEAAARATNPLNTTEDADSYNVFNLNGAWRFNDMVRLRVGIDNLLDEDPVITNRNVLAANPNTGSGTSSGDYDVLGRRYFIGLSVDF
jgi:outer membrane receptor protein involved in Fe transport